MQNNTYVDDVHMSRRLMNNMVNLMSHQERNMRQLINHRNTANTHSPYSYFQYNDSPSNTGLNTNLQTINRPQTATTETQGVNRRPQATNIPPVTTTPSQSSSNARLRFNSLFTPNHRITRRANIPSALEINSATNTDTFENIVSPQNNTCPITRDTFGATDNVTQIIQCGHTFNRDNLYEWFGHNSVCPMCRYDIRSYSRVDTINNSPRNISPVNEDVRNDGAGLGAGLGDDDDAAGSNSELTNIAEQIANDILSNLTDTPSNISLEYSLYAPIENNSTQPNYMTHRTSYDPSLNIY